MRSMSSTRNARSSQPSAYPVAPACVGAIKGWQRALRGALKGWAVAVRVAAADRPVRTKRRRSQNPDHHLWANNGTWFMHCTVYPSRCTKERLRYSLATKSVSIARRRRDAVFAALAAQGLLSTHGHVRASIAGLSGLRSARGENGRVH
jgi:hypothetical protein